MTWTRVAADRRSIASWVLYDMANTVFSFSIVSLYLPLYLHERFGLVDSVFGVGNSVAVAIMLVLSPALGAISDRARRRVPFLVGSSLACIAATLPLGFVSWKAAIVLFVVADIGFLSGLVFYDALLPTVSTPTNRGRVGSIGVGVGYLGSFAGLGVGSYLLHVGAGYAWIFVASALLFLILALPAFVWIREAGQLQIPKVHELWSTTRGSFAALARVLRGQDGTDAGRFLLSRVFYSDAVNTMILFMGLYVTTELHMTATQVTGVLAVGIGGAVVGAPVWGIVVDRLGAKRTLRGVLVAWMAALALTASFPSLGLDKVWFYPLAAFLGSCLGGTWSADRPLMVELAPPERIGEYYGYYGMVGRFSAIGGPLVWSLVVDVLHWGRSIAVVTLLVSVVVGWLALGGLEKDAGKVLPHPRL